MLKKILFFICIIFVLFITGCINKVKIPVGVKPTKEFTVYSYVNNDAIYQASNELVISGLSEEGVVIVSTLYDRKGNLINEAYCTTGANGIWNLKIDTPSSSNETYTLKIKDSNNIYHKTYNDIKFGEVWLFIGDELKNIDFEINENNEKEEENYDYNIMFFKDETWVPANKQTSQFNYLLAEEIYANNKSWNKHPVGIVFATSEEDLIYKWLSHTSISSRKLIMEYLKNQNLNYDSTNSLYEKYLKLYKNMSYANVIFNQGIADIKLYEESNMEKNFFKNIYSLQLYTFIGELIHELNISDNIFILQNSINTNDNVTILRSIQSNITNYYNVTSIIPTYDINLFYDINTDKITSDFTSIEGKFDIVGYDYYELVSRLNKFNYQNYKANKLDHVVQEYNDSNVMTSVKLIFEEKLDVTFNNIVKGFDFIDESGEKVELSFILNDNEIIINLEIDEVDSENKKYIDLKYIGYAQNVNIFDNNLFSSNIPVIPFEIILK